MPAPSKAPPHDIEKGIHSVSTSRLAFAFPQRRRKPIVAGLLIFIILYILYNTGQVDTFLSSTSWKWAKDSMRPISDKKNASPPHSYPVHNQEPPRYKNAANTVLYKPTSALIHLAEQMNLPVPVAAASDVVSQKPETSQDKPTHSDQVLLFLSAMKNKSYRIPELKVQRSEQIQPSSVDAFIRSMQNMQSSNVDDEKLYVESHSSWLEKYRNQSPLTVFSKSYCPYSRRAKEMLKGMGAHFEVYEVDLREDAHSLQDGLREFSGHATFPTIFIKDELIGGSDDLAHLQEKGVLMGRLKAAGVKFD